MRKTNHKVRIVMHDHGKGEIIVNDLKILGIFGFEVSAEKGRANRLTLHMHADEIEIEGIFDVATIERYAIKYKESQE